MAANDSIRNNLDAQDIASLRIEEAKALATVLAIATSPGEGFGPSSELVSLSLDGITALLEQAHDAVLAINRADLRRIA